MSSREGFGGCDSHYSMSTRDVRATPRRHTRNPRHSKSALDVDLNAVPVSENADQEGTSAHGGSQNVQAGLQRSSVPSVAIDLEAFDDDVIISSSSAFAEAKTNSRKNRGRTVVVDVDSGSPSFSLLFLFTVVCVALWVTLESNCGRACWQ
ncbi:unnamed protein product [Ilex paraguariensis]|uniref:Uncharacterized protein n=1 Tax=Ilex paraguariensis TaxID=185542 RepID=A0ABC8SY84_9AQUA